MVYLFPARDQSSRMAATTLITSGPPRSELRRPWGCGRHSISHLLLFTCALALITESSINFGPVLAYPAAGSVAVAPVAVAPNTGGPLAPLASAGNLSRITNNFRPLIQAAMVVAPKLAPAPLLGTSKSPMLAAFDKSLAMQQQQQGAGRLGIGQINQEEPIIQLDYSSISDEILNKNTANLVYFNANFNHCRHCQRFFSVWRDLALDIRWWRNVIKLFTINCSDEDNIDVCRRAGVTQFPQLKFYWVMSNSLNQDGQRLRILGKSMHAMRHLIMDKLLDSYLEHNKLLAQRERQRASASAVASGPFGLGGGGGLAGAMPLNALMPLISHLAGGGGSNGAIASPSSGLASIVGLLSGKPASQGGGLSLTGLMSSIGGMQGISQLISALMSVASWRRSLTLQPLPSNWPELEAIEAADTQQLLDMLPLGPGRASGALLVMETQEFLYTGPEVMLDLNPYAQNRTYYIARVRDERSQLSKKLTKLEDVQAPALIYVNELREPKLVITAPKYTNDEDLRRVFVRAFERRQIKYPVKRVWSTSSSSAAAAAGGPASVAGASSRASEAAEMSEADEEIVARTNEVYMNDLLNTIRSSLTDQVMRHPDLSDDQYNALVKYIYALINYFPFTSDEQLKFFKRLHAWLQNQVSPVDMAEYKKQFHDFDEHLGKRLDWIACKSLSSVNALQQARSGHGSLFENPSQLGKVVSNITRLFRANQQKVGQLKSLVGMFASSLNSPVVLQQQQQQQQSQRRSGALAGGGGGGASTTRAPGSSAGPSSTTTSRGPDSADADRVQDNKEESPLERLIKSVTSGSLGSDSSILKLISAALGGGGGGGSGGSGPNGEQKRAKSKFAREYSCGAWKLAHVMVANEYIRDSPRKDVKHIVLHSLYQYLLNFYACATCGNRVSDVSSEFRLNLNDHLNDQGDSIMLLWEMHNRVNKRLESELRPGSPPKQQFPSESLCAKCRTSRRQADSGVSTPEWHEKQVLNFLVHHYRPQSIITRADSSIASSSSVSAQNSVYSAGFGASTLTLWLTLLGCVLTLNCARFRVVLAARAGVQSNS